MSSESQSRIFSMFWPIRIHLKINLSKIKLILYATKSALNRFLLTVSLPSESFLCLKPMSCLTCTIFLSPSCQLPKPTLQYFLNAFAPVHHTTNHHHSGHYFHSLTSLRASSQDKFSVCASLPPLLFLL